MLSDRLTSRGYIKLKKIAFFAGCVLLLSGCSGVSANDSEAVVAACAPVNNQDWTNVPVDVMKTMARDFVSIGNNVSGLGPTAKETVQKVALLVADMDRHYDNMPDFPNFILQLPQDEFDAALEKMTADDQVWQAERLAIADSINEICGPYIDN
jgi:hypothetical protein